MSKKLRGFWNTSEARKRAPVVSRPDLVAARNAALADDCEEHSDESLRGFWRASEAVKPSPVISRPDLVRARNVAASIDAYIARNQDAEFQSHPRGVARAAA